MFWRTSVAHVTTWAVLHEPRHPNQRVVRAEEAERMKKVRTDRIDLNW